MQLTLTDEQRLIESSALDFLAAEYDFRQREASVADPQGCLASTWRHFAEMGWLGLPLAEAEGGLGGGMLDTGLVMRALGRHLVVEPYHSGIVLAARLASGLLVRQEAPTIKALLVDVIEGKARLALAHDEPGLHDPFLDRGTRARRTADGWELQGRKLLAIGATGASRILVTATDAEGATGVFAVGADAAGLSLRPCMLADGSRAADVALDRVEVDASARWGGSADAASEVRRVLADGIVALCWEASGTMQAALEQTAEYTRQRVQFGKPIAAFQVVQHRLAEMLVCCEEARASCELAALRIDRSPLDEATALRMASMAKSKVGRNARYVAQEAVQLHGGMGVCEELPVAAMFRKLTMFGQQMGATALHTARFGRMALDHGDWRSSQTLPETEGARA